jgi:hypothetical protein
MGNKMKVNLYPEMKKQGSYIILISGTCLKGELYIRNFFKQLYELMYGSNTGHSWNPRAKFVVPLMSNCTQLENKNISRAILEQLWHFQVKNAAVLFMNTNRHAGNDLQQNATVSAQSTCLELHTWYPYGNSDRCNPDEGTVPVKVFTVRNLSDISRSDIFRGYNDKNFNGCPITIVIIEKPLLWYSTDHYQTIDFRGWQIDLFSVIGNALNSSLHIVYPGDRIAMDKVDGKPYINFVSISPLHFGFDRFAEYTRSFLSVRFVWYTPCAVKYHR